MSFHTIPLGEKAPQIVNAVIEIPRGGHHKYEYDETMDEIKLDRVLHSPVFYPTDYGFIPQTRSEDGDHLDVMVLISEPLFPGCVVSVRIIGVLDMEDEAGQDWKIVGVADRDPKLSNITDITNMDEQLKKEIVQFFEQYKQLEGKWAKVKGWLDQKEAMSRILEAKKRFSDESTSHI